MHGDEPSATPALIDVASYLLTHVDEPEPARILDELTLLIVPMLNPDGAERYERRNAQGIDINRDALALATPEGRLLKRLRDEHEPILGFNLHDQNWRTAVGDTGRQATNAVLAVAGDPQGTLTPGRARAKRACAAIIETLAPFVPGGMARYDEDWSPRAFGDNLTAWGTPVVLLESGGLPSGRPYSDLARLNFVALVRVLADLARDDLAGHDPALYEALARNQSDVWSDVVVRGGRVQLPGSSEYSPAELAFDVFLSDQARAGCTEEGPTGSRIVEIGDLRYRGAGRDVDATGALVTAPFTVGAAGWRARRWLDAGALEALAHLGVGQVLWQVPARRAAAAGERAAALAAAGRPRVEVVTQGEARPPVVLSAAPTMPSAEAALRLGDLLSALGARSTADLWPAAATRRRGWLQHGGPASWLLLRPAGEEFKADAEARLEAVWLDGSEVVAAEISDHGLSDDSSDDPEETP
jgi:hypothetical protein